MAKINLLKLKAKIECKICAFSFTGKIMESMKCRKCAKPINLHESTYLTILLFQNNCLWKWLMFYVKFMNEFQISSYSKEFCCKNCLNILTGYKRINYHILINLTHSEWCRICHRISWKNWAWGLGRRFSNNIVRSSSVHVSPILQYVLIFHPL